MAVRDLPRKLTYEDYLLIPEDGQRHEVLDGEHYVTPSPFFQHQFTAGRLYLRLGNFVEAQGLGIVLFAPFDVLLSPHDVVQPDLLFVSKERAEIVVERYVHGAPDLVIEILSKSTRRRDERLKLERYDRFGVREYWMFDTERKTARIYRREGGRLVLAAEPAAAAGDTLTSSLLPGLEIPLNEIFQ
jgi:Uma2 family endonuclease